MVLLAQLVAELRHYIEISKLEYLPSLETLAQVHRRVMFSHKLNL